MSPQVRGQAGAGPPCTGGSGLPAPGVIAEQGLEVEAGDSESRLDALLFLRTRQTQGHWRSPAQLSVQRGVGCPPPLPVPARCGPSAEENCRARELCPVESKPPLPCASLEKT